MPNASSRYCIARNYIIWNVHIINSYLCNHCHCDSACSVWETPTTHLIYSSVSSATVKIPSFSFTTPAKRNLTYMVGVKVRLCTRWSTSLSRLAENFTAVLAQGGRILLAFYIHPSVCKQYLQILHCLAKYPKQNVWI